MAESSDTSDTVAAAPPGLTMQDLGGFEWCQLCFGVEEFMGEEFSCDALVVRHRRRVGLDRLRSDLGLCLRLLRAAMIELINRDYADFVNLSSNLVGLEAGIGRLRLPLAQLRELVLTVRCAFDSLLADTERRLARLHAVRAQKRHLRTLAALPAAVQRLATLLAELETASAGARAPALERAAAEHAQLQYGLRVCAGAALAEQLLPDAEQLQRRLTQLLQRALLDALQADADAVVHVLRVFATLDQVSEAERLLRAELVTPLLERLVSAAALRDSPRGLRGLLDAVLEAMLQTPAHRLLLGSAGTPLPPQFDFLAHAAFPALVERLELHVPAVFAAGNPDTFHRNYKACMQFLSEWEAGSGSRAAVARLRRTDAYQRLTSRWNLAVYFQIRLQEIGGALERALAKDADDAAALCAEPAVWAAVCRCWAPDVLLAPLTHRFWQLSLQLLARCCSATERRLQTAPPAPPAGCVLALRRLDALLARLDTLLERLVLPAIPTELRPAAEPLMRRSLAPARDRLQALRPQLQACYTDQLAAAGSRPLHAVSDIPRLYRRTNRDAPSAASGYVTAALAPLNEFAEAVRDADKQADAELGQLLAPAVAQLCQQYGEKVSHVLTSVQRMEESLRRLKRPRAAAASGAAGGSDDEKIRAQLRLDVAELGRRLGALGLTPAQLEPHGALTALVTADVPPAPAALT